MKTKKAIIMRHSESDHHGFLLPEAREKMKDLGLRLLNSGFFHESTELLCSEELRAIKTAQAIMVGAHFDRHENCHSELFSDGDTCDVPAALKVIGTYTEASQSLIIVTHWEMATVLPAAFGKRFLGVDTFPEYVPMGRGQGVEIDCVAKTIRDLRP